MIDFMKVNKHDLGKSFDYSVLPKETTEGDIRTGCRTAIKYNCMAFCYSSSYWTSVVKEELEGSDLLIGAAIGFPFGQQSDAVKCFETEEAVRLGATVLDSCMNVGDLKDKKFDKVLQDFKNYVDAAQGVTTKMILETCYLSDDEVATACKLVAESGIDWAKTSSGQFEGPTLEHVLIMVDTLKDSAARVKVAGVKFPRPQNAYTFMMAGAELIGTRAAPEIIDALDTVREIGLVPPYKN